MPRIHLDVTDALELGQTLQFINDWFAADSHNLEESLRRFIGVPHLDHLQPLRNDLSRFTFLLGADDGEALFDEDLQ